MENEKKLREAFQKALNLSDETNFEELAYGETEDWDSIAHMALIAAIEESFDIMIDTEDVIAMSSYNVAREILRKYEVAIAEK